LVWERDPRPYCDSLFGCTLSLKAPADLALVELHS
jgi:hypothetical protein